jgi:methionine-rich copper-binding protein CopC
MRKTLISIFVACSAFLFMPTSFAHVEIISSFPERFTNVNPIPTQVWIQFSADLQMLDGAAVNSLEVIDSTGITVNFDDPVIEGAKIMTKISGQSAPGAFIVKYRVVGDDGHVIEGDYTFNASPDYTAVPTTTLEPEKKSSLNIGGVVLVVFLIIFAVGYIINEKKGKK